MRKTKIICTIGPASESEEKLRELMLAGMNVARFNFSHGSHKEQLVKYNRVLKVRKELGLPVATLLDTKGPDIRLHRGLDGPTESICRDKSPDGHLGSGDTNRSGQRPHHRVCLQIHRRNDPER